jgi:uncharacterized damage-inducible protein DinB
MIYPSLAERLKNQHTVIPAIIEKLDDRQLNYHAEPGKWSIHDNIVHLAKYQLIFSERIGTILTTDNPSFDRYRADDDHGFHIWRNFSTGKLIEKLAAERENIYRKIMGLSETELAHTGNHPRYGKLTIAEWTEFFLLHEAHHLFTIFQLANRSEP